MWFLDSDQREHYTVFSRHSNRIPFVSFLTESSSGCQFQTRVLLRPNVPFSAPVAAPAPFRPPPSPVLFRTHQSVGAGGCGLVASEPPCSLRPAVTRTPSSSKEEKKKGGDRRVVFPRRPASITPQTQAPPRWSGPGRSTCWLS